MLELGGLSPVSNQQDTSVTLSVWGKAKLKALENERINRWAVNGKGTRGGEKQQGATGNSHELSWDLELLLLYQTASTTGRLGDWTWTVLGKRGKPSSAPIYKTVHASLQSWRRL